MRVSVALLAAVLAVPSAAFAAGGSTGSADGGGWLWLPAAFLFASVIGDVWGGIKSGLATGAKYAVPVMKVIPGVGDELASVSAKIHNYFEPGEPALPTTPLSASGSGSRSAGGSSGGLMSSLLSIKVAGLPVIPILVLGAVIFVARKKV
jgi:hypothetical protein